MIENPERYPDDELRQKSRRKLEAAVKTGLTGRLHIPNTATETDRKRAREKILERRDEE